MKIKLSDLRRIINEALTDEEKTDARNMLKRADSSIEGGNQSREKLNSQNVAQYKSISMPIEFKPIDVKFVVKRSDLETELLRTYPYMLNIHLNKEKHEDSLELSDVLSSFSQADLNFYMMTKILSAYENAYETLGLDQYFHDAQDITNKKEWENSILKDNNNTNEEEDVLALYYNNRYGTTDGKHIGYLELFFKNVEDLKRVLAYIYLAAKRNFKNY